MQATGTGYKITSSPNTASSIPTEATIAGGNFWPDIEPSHFRAAMRLDGTITPKRLRAELISAIQTVQILLSLWKVEQQAVNATPFDATAPAAEVIDGKTITHHSYLRAIYCYAAANLQERYRAFDNTAEGKRRADALEPAIDDLRRDAYHAIADITGKQRCVIDLV